MNVKKIPLGEWRDDGFDTVASFSNVQNFFKVTHHIVDSVNKKCKKLPSLLSNREIQKACYSSQRQKEIFAENFNQKISICLEMRSAQT